MSRGLNIAGLALTAIGATVLVLRDLTRGRGFKRPVWDDVALGMPRPEAKIGFPLIVAGTVLQIIALSLE